MNDPKAFILRILEIIDYSQDKEKYATEFLQNVSLQALLDLIDTLPQDKKDQIQKQMVSVGNDSEGVDTILKSYFTQIQIQDSLQNASKNAVTEYMKAIDPTLSETQRTNIANFAKELNQNNQSNQPTL